MQNGTASMENSWAVSNKTEHTLTIHSSNPVPSYLPKAVEKYKVCPEGIQLCNMKNRHSLNIQDTGNIVHRTPQVPSK